MSRFGIRLRMSWLLIPFSRSCAGKMYLLTETLTAAFETQRSQRSQRKHPHRRQSERAQFTKRLIPFRS
jgi:hypothetical protein